MEQWRDESQKAAEKVWADDYVSKVKEEQQAVELKHRRRGYEEAKAAKDMERQDALFTVKKKYFDDPAKHDPERVGPWGITLAKSTPAKTNEEFCSEPGKSVIVNKENYIPRLPGVLYNVHDSRHENWDFRMCSLYSLELCHATCGMTPKSCRDEYVTCMKASCPEKQPSSASYELNNMCEEAADRHADDALIFGGRAVDVAREDACTCVNEQDKMKTRRHILSRFYQQWAPNDQHMVEKILPITHISTNNEDRFATMMLRLHAKYKTVFLDTADAADVHWQVLPPDEKKMKEAMELQKAQLGDEKSQAEKVEMVKAMMTKLQTVAFEDLNSQMKSEEVVVVGTSDHIHRPYIHRSEALTTVSTCPPTCFEYTCDHWKRLGTYSCAFLRPRCNNCDGCGICGTPESEKDDIATYNITLADRAKEKKRKEADEKAHKHNEEQKDAERAWARGQNPSAEEL